MNLHKTPSEENNPQLRNQIGGGASRSETQCTHPGSGEACATRAVWWVVELAVVGALVALACPGYGVAVIVHASFWAKHLRDVSQTVCVFPMRVINVRFVPTRHRVLLSA